MLKCFYVAGSLFIQNPDGHAINASLIESIEQTVRGGQVYLTGWRGAITERWFIVEGPDIMGQIAACAKQAEDEIINEINK